MRWAFQATADALESAAADLGRLDAHAGDGDLGITARLMAGALRDAEVLGGVGATLKSLALEISEVAPSTAGTLLASGLLRAAAAIGDDSTQAHNVADALAAASEGIQERGRSKPGEKTMVDALAPAARAAREVERDADVVAVLDAAASAAEKGARTTAQMTAVRGRAGWLSERSQGHEDAGANLVAIVLRAIAHAAAAADSPDADS